MDWGVFHVKREFLGYWRRYQRALSQRNAALRTAQAEELIHAWEQDFCAAGAEVDRLRAHYVEELKPHFESLGRSPGRTGNDSDLPPRLGRGCRVERCPPRLHI